MAVTALVLTTACAPAPDVEAHLLERAAAGTPVPVVDLIAEADWDRFTVLCPYEERADAAARLDVDGEGIPDLASRDDRQALLVVSGDRLSAAAFPRDRIDLCAASGWQAYARGTASTVDVERDGDRVIVTPTPPA